MENNLIAIVVGLSSGAIGVLIGAILSAYLDYKFKLSLIKKEFKFKEKAKHYERISEKINQIYDWHQRAVRLDDRSERVEETIRRLSAHKSVMEHFLKLDPPSFDYVSPNIKEYLNEYYRFLNEISKRKDYSEEELNKITYKINSFTSKIIKQIKKEID